MKVDILLPIYNSVSEVRNCIESILNNTSATHYDLYLLDDCSTDPEVMEISEYYTNEYKNIFSYRHKVNLGFPGNVNFGLNLTQNDVVILNSDTIVTKNWLTKLIDASNLNEKIAAVNPLTNYGVISSIPTIYEKVNNEFTIDEITNAIDSLQETNYPEVPMLVGFCMYMKRKAINEVGIFDAKTFNRGYGEETDWCLRAKNLGYKLIICDDCYVKHIGASSFGDEKTKLIERSTKIINKKYPYYHTEIMQFQYNHPLKYMRINLSRKLRVPIKDRLRYELRLKKMRIRHILKPLHHMSRETRNE
ncbi:glycosyltransferase family 2 protein [Paenibacillus sp. PDC88]|uniref:glycosyltransferase family 2 protein n=1 Tax=Paenibacillus sp. PDC88 TaxID=1884375 RepID=UPI0008996180|nr:glycosyltransferase family 2 protein [Paenibacillus sp. PDC88]SDX31377.1 Glycosyltransferase, GT2 family [Paenibacillus sp. PDC88]